MFWYKHLTVSLDDPDICEAMERFGSDGYLVFFGTLECMAREFDIKNPGKNSFRKVFLKKKLQISVKKMSKIFCFFSEKDRIKCIEDEGSFHLYCSKLKDLADEYTLKKLRTVSGQPPASEQEVELELDKPDREKGKKDDPNIFLALFKTSFKRVPSPTEWGQFIGLLEYPRPQVILAFDAARIKKAKTLKYIFAILESGGVDNGSGTKKDNWSSQKKGSVKQIGDGTGEAAKAAGHRVDL